LAELGDGVWVPEHGSSDAGEFADRVDAVFGDEPVELGNVYP
jgi:hypothetical protein